MNDEYFVSGHDACQGCGTALAVRWIAKAAASQSAIIVSSFGKIQEISNKYPYTSWRLPILFAGRKNLGEVMHGAMKGNKKIIGLVGYEELFENNLQSIISLLNKNASFTLICYDNVGDPRKAKMMKELGFKYVATASINDVNDIYFKIIKALETTKTSYIQILTPCPTEWGIMPYDTINMAKQAIETCYYPIFEIDRTTTLKRIEAKPMHEFIKSQDRFNKIRDEEIELVEQRALNFYKSLL